MTIGGKCGRDANRNGQKKNKKRVQLSKYDIALFIKDMTDIHLVSAFIPVCCMGCIQWNGMGWFGLGKEWIHMWIIPVCRLVGRLFLTVSTSNQLTMYKFLYGAEIKVFLKSVCPYDSPSVLVYVMRCVMRPFVCPFLMCSFEKCSNLCCWMFGSVRPAWSGPVWYEVFSSFLLSIMKCLFSFITF